MKNESNQRVAGEEVSVQPARCPLPRWGRWAGIGAFVFFLVKGLAWLAVPAVLAWWAS